MLPKYLKTSKAYLVLNSTVIPMISPVISLYHPFHPVSKFTEVFLIYLGETSWFHAFFQIQVHTNAFISRILEKYKTHI